MTGRWVGIETNLAGTQVNSAAYMLEIEEREFKISFQSHRPAFLDPSRPTGFHEGLWRYDCGELWLLNRETGAYVETNVAPNGAYWSCVFAFPRLRDGAIEPPRCTAQSWIAPQGWMVTLSIPRSEVERCLGPTDNLSGNVTLILGGCPDIDPPLENLHSVVPLGAIDFHRPQDWVPLTDLM